jgi:Short C-terminal domain
MFRRRRPIARAAIVGGTAYYAGKKVQEGREQDADTDQRLDELEGQQAAAQAPPPPPPAGGMTDEKIEQLKKLSELKDQGVLTEEEFAEQKAKLLEGP